MLTGGNKGYILLNVKAPEEFPALRFFLDLGLARPFDDGRLALTDAHAQRRQAILYITTASHLVQQRGQDARAARGQRVRHRAAPRAAADDDDVVVFGH